MVHKCRKENAKTEKERGNNGSKRKRMKSKREMGERFLCYTGKAGGGGEMEVKVAWTKIRNFHKAS
jgi:hypothetical protein